MSLVTCPYLKEITKRHVDGVFASCRWGWSGMSMLHGHPWKQFLLRHGNTNRMVSLDCPFFEGDVVVLCLKIKADETEHYRSAPG